MVYETPLPFAIVAIPIKMQVVDQRMTSKDQPKPPGTQKRSLILGILAVVLLIVGLSIWLRWTSQQSVTDASSPTLQINLPSVEYPTIPPSAPEFTVPLHSLNDSGITGRVTFKDIAGNVAILLYVDGLPGEEESEESLMPAEIRYGTCAAPGAIAYPMSAPDAGQSETDLSIELKQFNTQKPMAVILYRSPQDHTIIACGDIQ